MRPSPLQTGCRIIAPQVVKLCFNEHAAEDAALVAQTAVLLEALAVYQQRNRDYKDNWKRMGWRGVLVRIRERADRLWDSMFWTDPPSNDYSKWSYKRMDDAIDLINFAGFLVRAAREGEADRDGDWWKQPS